MLYEAVFSFFVVIFLLVGYSECPLFVRSVVPNIFQTLMLTVTGPLTLTLTPNRNPQP